MAKKRYGLYGYESQVTTVGNSVCIVLPRLMFENLEWKLGDVIGFSEVRPNDTELTLSNIDEDLREQRRRKRNKKR